MKGFTMISYKNLSGDSGVKEYEIGSNFIKIRFIHRKTVFVYDHSHPGSAHVEKMKRFAKNGKGLANKLRSCSLRSAQVVWAC